MTPDSESSLDLYEPETDSVIRAARAFHLPLRRLVHRSNPDRAAYDPCARPRRLQRKRPRQLRRSRRVQDGVYEDGGSWPERGVDDYRGLVRRPRVRPLRDRGSHAAPRLLCHYVGAEHVGHTGGVSALERVGRRLAELRIIRRTGEGCWGPIRAGA